VFGRNRRPAHESRQPSTATHITPDQQEDLDAVNQSIEEARSELLWLRDQVVKERARLDRLKREAQAIAGDQRRRQPVGSGFQQAAPPRFRPDPRQQTPPPGFQGAPRQRPQATVQAVDSPWVVLGLRPGSSADDIRRRYRLLSRVWHPDRFTDGAPELRAEAEMMMARLNRAYNALTNPAAGQKH
jgi:hypothetical protein